MSGGVRGRRRKPPPTRSFWKLLVIFLERTIIAIPLIVLFANMIGL
jgi:hypothetical protein